MKRWPLAVTMLAACLPAPAAAALRAVFVGVDKYLYSRTNLPTANFDDLRGAVGDVGRIKAALRTAYGLDLDDAAPGRCTGNAVSITLLDGCATRAAR